MMAGWRRGWTWDDEGWDNEGSSTGHSCGAEYAGIFTFRSQDGDDACALNHPAALCSSWGSR